MSRDHHRLSGGLLVISFIVPRYFQEEPNRDAGASALSRDLRLSETSQHSALRLGQSDELDSGAHSGSAMHDTSLNLHAPETAQDEGDQGGGAGGKCRVGADEHPAEAYVVAETIHDRVRRLQLDSGDEGYARITTAGVGMHAQGPHRFLVRFAHRH